MVLSYSLWYANDALDFTGKFVFIHPPEDDMGNSNGGGNLDNLFLIFTNVVSSNIGFSVFAYTSIEVEGCGAPMVDTLKNARLECEGEMLISSSCSLVSDSYAGEFVILKYKTKQEQ